MGLKFKELAEALKSAVSRPYTVRYPYIPSPPPESYRGRPEFQDKCMGCGACAEVCPPKAITVSDEADTRTIEIAYGHCIGCGQCVSSCPVEGIRMTTNYTVFSSPEGGPKASVKRTLVRCAECGEVITTLDHLRWLIERLGSLSFSNSTLLSVWQAFAEGIKPEEIQGGPIKPLCPKCRRKLVLSEHGWRAKY
jgi:hydrogenase-4 component H